MDTTGQNLYVQVGVVRLQAAVAMCVTFLEEVFIKNTIHKTMYLYI